MTPTSPRPPLRPGNRILVRDAGGRPYLVGRLVEAESGGRWRIAPERACGQVLGGCRVRPDDRISHGPLGEESRAPRPDRPPI